MRRILFLVLMVSSGLFLSPNSASGQEQFSEPALLTSAGQSADILMAQVLCAKAGITPASKPLATKRDLKGVKTLIVVAGFSSKGLGAAGISREQEMERVQGILKAARAQSIKILTLHLGGTARRGSQSDDFNRVAAEAATSLIVVKQGDEDNFFSDIAAKKKIPLTIAEKMAKALEPLKKAFGK